MYCKRMKFSDVLILRNLRVKKNAKIIKSLVAKENVKLFHHHNLDTYGERLEFLISRQINTGDNITDPIAQVDTERGETVNELREETVESVTQPYVMGIYEGDYESGDMVEY